VEKILPDLTAGATVSSTAERPLIANQGCAWWGVTLVGNFVIEPGEAAELLALSESYSEVIRPFRNGRDLTAKPRGVYVLDFGLKSEEEARVFSVPFDLVRTRVKPSRDSNRRASRRLRWWKFGEACPALREALEGLDSYIATSMTAKHRFFTLLDSDILPDQSLVVVASEDPFLLGVLSSCIHMHWALAAGSRLGVGNDPRYNNRVCFDAFPFPAPDRSIRKRLGEVAGQLNEHRASSISRESRVTMTGIYNVLEKLRSGDALTSSERRIHDLAACGVLLDLHNELDALVAEAYGWPWPMEREEILQRLVDLHDERVEEEKAGKVRWLRPDYQIPRFGKDIEAEPQELDLGKETEPVADVEKGLWPSTTIEQIGALQDLLNRHPSTLTEAAASFKGARKDQVERHLETLVIMGEAWTDPSGGYHLVGGSSV
jgi:hypothetical protein